jgi:hypothetical protein
VRHAVVHLAVAHQQRPFAAALAGAAVVLLVVLLLLIGLLIRRYRSECHQLRARNRQLSMENDRWHEDFAVQTGELSALRRTRAECCSHQLSSHAEAS